MKTLWRSWLSAYHHVFNIQAPIDDNAIDQWIQATSCDNVDAVETLLQDNPAIIGAKSVVYGVREHPLVLIYMPLSGPHNDMDIA